MENVFVPHKQVAINVNDYDAKVHKALHSNDYNRIFQDIADERIDEVSAYRSLILTDLWFVLYFCLNLPQSVRQLASKPFVVRACQMVEGGADSYTLDVWAREHFKSTIITVCETIQYILKNPNNSVALFSYARPVAKAFLRSIKTLFETSKLLQVCFPDVLWDNPQRDAPKWSEDDGLIVKRKTIRKESTLEACGLIEGMPTSRHYDLRIYDDISTEDTAENINVMEKIKTKFDSSQNLGVMEGGTHRVIGTFYHHADPLIYIRDLKKKDGTKAYTLRLMPATEDGSPNGVPVLLPDARLEELSLTKTFFCQQLLDPTPKGVQKLDSTLLKEIDAKDVPNDLYKFMLIDPAGEAKSTKGDSWAILLVGVDANTDDLGASNIYLLDALISPLREVEGIEEAVRMYLRNGMILQVGVEKVALSTTEIHIANALSAKGRHISVQDGSLVILRPAGRSKVDRIEKALAWTLANGKIHLSTSVPIAYRERLKMEMDKFPYWHDDGLDALSYLYDVVKDYGGFTSPKVIKSWLSQVNHAVQPMDAVAGY